MDGSHKKLLPLTPYILQDLWEIGAGPDALIKLIRKHYTNCADLKVLDLGCGKGVVSVKISKSLGRNCHGIVRSKFRIGGQETAPQSLMANTLNH